MKVMGIDPGTVKMGVGVIKHAPNSFEALFYKTVHIDSKLPLHQRLQRIYIETLLLLETWHPDVIALEDVYYGMSFKASIRIGEARCAVILAAVQHDIEVVEYPPARVKSAVCGFGRAAKVQVQKMVKSILQLKEIPPSDAADALALAICHSNNAALTC